MLLCGLVAIADYVSAGEAVTVGYTPPAGAGKLRLSGGGAAVAAFSGQTVTNGQRQVQPPPEPVSPLTARFMDAPSEHSGTGVFALRVAFSAPVAGRAKDADVQVSGGTLTRAVRVNKRKDLWELRVRPSGSAAVTVTLPAASDCAASGAVCTADGRGLASALTHTVQGAVALSVADASAREAPGATVDFAVTLSRAASGEVTVRYATKNGTAKRNKDYHNARGKLVFAAGETSKTVSVTILDDAHNEGAETFTLRLSKPKGATIADGEAVGTIKNADPLQVRTASKANYDDRHGAGKHATGSAGAEVALARMEVQQAPAKPTGLTATAGDAQVGLGWTGPSDSTITKHQYRRKAGASAWGSWADIPGSAPGGANATSFTVTGLTNGMAYHFRIRAVNAAGNGPRSRATPAVTPTAPAAPTEVTATTEANAAPAFDPADLSRSVAENAAVGTNVGAAIPEATDGDGDALTYALGGTDAASFDFDAAARQIKVRAGAIPDHEAKSSYTVSVTASDTHGASGSVTVTISVTDLDEAGSVLLGPGTPAVGTALTASLADPDGGVGSLAWQWSKSSTKAGAYVDIPGATSASYTPVADDAGAWLRATASYADGHSAGKHATGSAGAEVALARMEAQQALAGLAASIYLYPDGADGPVGRSFWVTVQFSDDVTTAPAKADFRVVNGTVAGILRRSARNYTVSIDATTSGDVSVELMAGAVVNAQGQGNQASTFTVTADKDRPGTSITGPEGPVGSAFQATITFTEKVAGLTVAEVGVGNGTASSLTGVGMSAGYATTWTVTITPTASGPVTVDVPADAARDTAGRNLPGYAYTNGNTKARTFSVQADLDAPTITITSGDPGPVNGAFPIQLTSSEPVRGLGLSDIEVSNGKASDLSAGNIRNGYGTMWTATVTPARSGRVTVSVPAGSVQDAVDRGNAEVTPLVRLADLDAPTVLRIATAAGTSMPVRGPFGIVVSFSEPVRGLALDDFSVENGTASALSGSQADYTATITPKADGQVGVKLRAKAAKDAAGNGSEESASLTVAADLIPGVVITAATGPVSGPFTITLKFTEAVSGLELTDIRVNDNGTASSLKGSGDTWTATITPARSGKVTVNFDADEVQDGTGNGNTAALPLVREADLDRSSASLTGPTSAQAGPFKVRVVFNEDVIGLATADFAAVNGSVTAVTAVNPTPAGYARTYDVDVAPSASGSVKVTLAANGAQDDAGNGNLEAEFTVQADLDALTATIVLPDLSPARAVKGPFTLTVNFSKPVTGLTAADFQIGNGNVASPTPVKPSDGYAATWTATVTPAASGNVTVSVRANAVQDRTAKGNEAADQVAIRADFVAPTVSRIVVPGETATGPFDITVEFSEAVGIAPLATFIQVTNGAASDLRTGETPYAAAVTVTITPADSGKVKGTVGQSDGAFWDEALNQNTAEASFTAQADLPPTVTLSGPSSAVNGPFPVKIEFNEDVTGLAASEIDVTNGSVTGLVGEGAKYTATVKPAKNGNVTINVPQGAAVDSLGSGNTVSATLTVRADLHAPTVQLGYSATLPVKGVFRVSIRFSEPVTELTSAGINVENGTFTVAEDPDDTDDTRFFALVTPDSDGRVALTILSGAVRDLVGNSNEGTVTLSVIADLSPTVKLSSAVTNPVGDFQVSVAFSESVTGFEAGDLSVSGGTVVGVTGSGASYTATIRPGPSLNVTISLPAGVVKDVSGNANVRADPLTVTLNRENVLIGTITGPEGPVAGAFNVEVIFNSILSSASEFSLSSIEVGNGAASDLSPPFVRFGPNGFIVYRFTVTPASSGKVTVDLPANRVQLGNGDRWNVKAKQFQVLADLDPPVVRLRLPDGVPKRGTARFAVEITVSEEVTGLDLSATDNSDLKVANGAHSAITWTDATTASVTVTATADGFVNISVPVGAVTDHVGHKNTDEHVLLVPVDVAPSVLITTSAVEPVNSDESFNATVTFSEVVTGFELSDLTVLRGRALSMTGSGSTYSVVIEPAGVERGCLDQRRCGPWNAITIQVPAGAAQDKTGNKNSEASLQVLVDLDGYRPTVNVRRSDVCFGTTQTAVPVTGPFVLNFRTSAATGGRFTIGDLVTSNGFASDWLHGGESTFCAIITPSSDGQVVVIVPVGAFGEPDHPNIKRTFSVQADVAPKVTISSEAQPPVAGRFDIDITFDDEVTGLTLTEIEVANGTVSNLRGSGTAYEASITPSASGTVTVALPAGAAQDGAKNDNLKSAPYSIRADLSGPVPMIEGPKNWVTGPFPIRVLFNKKVSGLTADEIVVGNGSVSNLQGLDTTFTATVSPTASGRVTVDIEAGAVQDEADRDSVKARQYSVEADLVPPTVNIETDAKAVEDGPFAVRIVFSEGVTGFTKEEISVTGRGRITGDLAVSSDKTTYTATVTPVTSGSIVLDVPAGVAKDEAGNLNEAAAAVTVTVKTANGAPEFGSAVTREVAENTAADTAFGAPVTAEDPDTGATLTYSLGGTDATSFAIEASTGQLKTKAALDHETKDSYSLAVSVTDGLNASGEADTAVDATVDVTVTVTNVDEPGSVSFDSGTPAVGTALTASLEDPDGSVSSLTWQWAKSTTQGGTYTDISAATSATYTPVAADAGAWLRATASYSDAEGSDKSAAGQTLVAAVATQRGGAPAVTLSLSEASISENGGVSTVTASLDRASTAATTVMVKVAPDSPATASDYQLSANKALTIAAGSVSSTGTVTVTAVNNDIDAADKTVQVKGDAANSVGVTDPADVTLTLQDDDSRGVTLSRNELEVDEGGEETYTVVLDTEPTETVTVTPSRSSGDADVTVSDALTFTKSDWSTAQTVTVSAAQDADTDNDAAVIGHAVAGGDYASFAADTVSVTITDDDAAPSGEIALALDPASAGEDAEATSVTVTATLPGTTTRSADTEVTVKIGKDGDAAAEGADYATVADVTLTVPAGSRSGTASFSIDPTQDAVDEGAGEAVTVHGTTAVSGLTVGEATFTITDDDAAPSGEIALALDPASAGEDAEATSVTVTATLPGTTTRSADTEVTVKIGKDGDAAAEGADYATVADVTLTVPAGSRSGTASFSIDPTQDAVDEGAGEAVTVHGTTAVSGLTVGEATFTITDDDAAPSGEIALALDPASAGEDAEATSVTVTATLPGTTTRSADTEVTVKIGKDGDAAAEGADYATVADVTLTVPAGSRSGTASFSIDPTQDAVDEGAGEAVTVHGTTAVSGLTVGEATFTITDDDAAPSGEIALALDPASAGEDAEATSVTVTATLPGTTTRSADTEVTVKIGKDGDAAAEGADYATVADVTLTVPAGSRSGTASFSIDPTQDAVDEGAGEAVTVHGTTAVSGLTVGEATFTITDDDAAPSGEIALALDPASAGEGDAIIFTVRLNRAVAGGFTVTPSCTDVTAIEGTDYTDSPIILKFTGAAGETKTFAVATKEDDEVEADETFTVSLAVSETTEKVTATGMATGTIIDDDRIAPQQAWIARMGRTVADQVIEAVDARMQATRTMGIELILGGHRVARYAGAAAARPLWPAEDPGEQRRELHDQGMSQKEFLRGSAFSLATGEERIDHYALWGRGAVSRFDGSEGTLTVDGEVASAFLGADWSREKTTLGLIVGYSIGEGGYRSGDGSGTVSSTLTGLYPWMRHALGDRLSAWGVAGYAEGSMKMMLVNADGSSQAALRTDLDLIMAAAGLRGVVVEASAAGGLELAVKSDAMGVRTRSLVAAGLAGATAEVTRLRLGLEGSHPFRFEGGAALTPSLKVGVRQDGGDAETGFGVDVGGGIAWSDPRRGLFADLQGRGLMSHDSKGFREAGLSGSFSWNLRGDKGRGPSLTLSQIVGSQATGGMDELLGRETLAGLAANDNAVESGAKGGLLSERRLELELGYGMPALGGRFTSTPEIGFGLSETDHDYRLGWRLARQSGAGSFGLSLEAIRHESANDAEPEHTVGISLDARW